MTSRLLRLTLVSLLCSLPVAVLAQSTDSKRPPRREEETELGKAMSTLNSAWRKLRRQAGDAASNESSLALVATIKTAALKSVTLIPEKAKEVPAASREQFVQDYQKQMKEFVADLDKLSAAFKASDNATAQTLITTLGAMQRDGHKEFRKEAP